MSLKIEDYKMAATLLKIESKKGPIYFVLEDKVSKDHSPEQIRSHQKYMYTEKLDMDRIYEKIVATLFDGSKWPSIFEYVDTAIVPEDLIPQIREDNKDLILSSLFDELSEYNEIKWWEYD